MRHDAPGPDEVRMWWIEPEPPSADVGRQGRDPGSQGLDMAALAPEEAALAPAEAARARQMTDPDARAAYVRRRGALRSLLGRCLDVPPRDVRLTVDAHGKPVLGDAAAPLAFSVSQATGTWAVIALCGSGPLGVDVESHDQAVDVTGLARRFLPDLDLDGVPDDERPTAFWRAWTHYEATLKAAGATLGHRPGPAATALALTRPPAPRGHTVALVTARPPATVTTRLYRAPTGRAPTCEGPLR
ncbi:4'-phosphopantetheinyl transferase family protein [Streptomyces sp. NPDC059063]|uniref:4'-phosphopantetheinyl transferase family protein n=1 Tax=unclassified Streptomyces TaxID=2593676 RepID=UPI0036B25F1C